MSSALELGVERFVDSSPLTRNIFEKGKRGEGGTKQRSSCSPVMPMVA